MLTDLTEGKEEFSCIYAKFSKDGILCSHILKVMIEKEIIKIPDKYIIDRWRKKDMRLIKQRMDEKTVETSSLLRFNVLSRKSIEPNSKVAKQEEATEYIFAEMHRIEEHLNKMLAPPTSRKGHNEQTSHEQIQTNGTANRELNSSETVIEDPHTTTKRGRPTLQKRMKTQIEQVREKMIQQESKKKKKATSTVNSSKKTTINLKMGNYSKDNFSFSPVGSPIKPKSKRVKKTTSKNNGTQPSNSGGSSVA